MNSTGKAKEFEELWSDSFDRAARRPTWDEMTLAEQKWVSSRFRREMNLYGDEDPTAGNRMESGLYGSPQNSNSPGSPPGGKPETGS